MAHARVSRRPYYCPHSQIRAVVGSMKNTSFLPPQIAVLKKTLRALQNSDPNLDWVTQGSLSLAHSKMATGELSEHGAAQ